MITKLTEPNEDRPLRIVGIAGSLRQASVSRRLIASAIDLAPKGVVIRPLELRPLPFYDADLEGGAAPSSVVDFKQAIADADGILIASPEYNHSVSGVLKNTIDWASRPAYRSVLLGKPIAIVGSGSGPVGGARGIAHLQQIMLGTASLVMPGRDVLIDGRAEPLGACFSIGA